MARAALHSFPPGRGREGAVKPMESPASGKGGRRLRGRVDVQRRRGGQRRRVRRYENPSRRKVDADDENENRRHRCGERAAERAAVLRMARRRGGSRVARGRVGGALGGVTERVCRAVFERARSLGRRLRKEREDEQ
jgi:hypothetical protein